MARRGQRALVVIGAIAGGAGFVVLVLLLVSANLGLSPVLFLALVIAAIIAVLLVLFLRGRGQSARQGARREVPSRPEERRADRRTVASDAAGLKPETADAAPGDEEPDRSGTLEGTDRNVASLEPRPAETATEHGETATDRGRAGTGLEAASGPPLNGSTAPVGMTKVLSNAVEDGHDAMPVPETRTADGSAGAIVRDEDTAGHPTAMDTDPADGGATISEGAGSDQAASRWKSSQLPGELELKSRPGTWRYTPEEEGEATREASVSERETGAVSGGFVDIGTEPRRLSGPREDGPDDLKKIKGIGPKLEAMLNRMGFYHFDQLAGWSDQEVAWVDENLEGLRGRVIRDKWVPQARILAEGGKTEFAKQVSGKDGP